jgi:hypothetical protein
MSVFDEREKTAERKFELDQELTFKMVARRNKLLGKWAAWQLGLSGEAAERYALEIVDEEVLRHSDGAIIGRIAADFLANGFPITPEAIRRHLDRFAAQARREVMQGA